MPKTDRRKKHEEKREIIRASLSKKDDADVIEYLSDKKPLSIYLQQLVRQEMKNELQRKSD